MAGDDRTAHLARRIRIAVKRALIDSGLAQKELAAMAGMSEQVLSHFLCGRRKHLRDSERQRIAEALGISPEILAPESSGAPGDLGEAALLGNAGAANIPRTTRTAQISQARDGALLLPPRQARLVPVYPIGAGYEISFDDGDMPVGESLEDPIVIDSIADPNAFAGRIVGTSMDPGAAGEVGFREGDIVVFDTKAEARDGHYCLIRFVDGGGTFKQIFHEGDGIRLHALNPEIGDEQRQRPEIAAIYRAVRHVKSL